MNYKQVQKLNKQNKVLILKQFQNENEIAELIHNQKYHQMLTITSYLDSTKFELIGKQLIHLDQLINLDVNFDYYTLQSIDIFGQNLKFLQNLNYLQIRINQIKNNQTQSYDISEIGNSLSHLKKLMYFSLDLNEASLIGIQGAKSIRNGLQDLNQLESIFYFLQFKDQQNDLSILIELCQGFKYYNNLKKLQISLNEGQNIQDQGFAQILTDLKYLTSLESFKIIIENENKFQINNIGLFRESVPFMKNLTQLKISISYQIRDINILNQFTENLFELQNLQQLVLKIKMYFTENQGYIFGKNIKVNSELLQLKVKFIYQNLRHNKLTLDKDITNLKNLKIFNLDILNGNLNEQNTLILEELLNNNLYLENIRLYFYDYITQKSFQMISKSIGKLQSLKKLDLQFYHQSNEEDQLILVKEISKLQSLEKLELDLHLNHFEMNQQISEIINGKPKFFNRLIQLKELVLDEELDYSSNLSILGKCLKQFNNLQFLTISPSILNEDSQFMELIESFQFLANLKSLQLLNKNIFGSYQVTLKGHLALQLFEGVSKIQNLADLKVSIDLQSDHMYDVQQQIGQILSKMIQLRVFSFGKFFMAKQLYSHLFTILKRKQLYLINL